MRTCRSIELYVFRIKKGILRRIEFALKKGKFNPDLQAGRGYFPIPYDLPRILGSSTSRIASPTRFQPITNKVRTRPG